MKDETETNCAHSVGFAGVWLSLLALLPTRFDSVPRAPHKADTLLDAYERSSGQADSDMVHVPFERVHSTGTVSST